MKRLADFIRNNMDSIIGEWENYAQGLPPGKNMSRHALRDHLPSILDFIADDIGTTQSDVEQRTKSQGNAPDAQGSQKETAAETHGILRLESGFDIVQMVSEFRALRASVTRLWRAQLIDPDDDQFSDLVRFNEAVDQCMAESIARFTEELDASKDLFLGILGHDLRNPLGAIAMSAHLLKMKGPLNATQTKLANQIEDSAARIGDMTTDLLDLTRARLGSGIPIEKHVMDFTALTHRIVQEIQIAHPDWSVLLRTEHDVRGEGDEARIEQVLSNLLGNAVQYGLKGAPVTIALDKDAHHIRLSVHNRGKPIPASTLPRLFESLMRGPNGDIEQDRGSTNLGLGLYIARMIMCAHGGDLTVVSNEKDGTTFTASFPVS